MSLPGLARDVRAYLEFLRESGLVFVGVEASAPLSEPVVLQRASGETSRPLAPPPDAAPAQGATPERPVSSSSPCAAEDSRSTGAASLALESATVPLSQEQRAEAWKGVVAEIADCRACRLHESRTNTVPGVGTLTADLMFIGEGPGADEDRQGEPFVGRAGQKLNEMIAYLGFTRDDVSIINIVKCRPPGNRNPERDEAAACRAFLDRQIAIVQPRVLCLLGAVALKHITGKMTISITRTRGHWMEYAGIPTMPTLHPAYLLRAYTRENRSAVASDMDQIREKLQELGCRVGEKPGNKG